MNSQSLVYLNLISQHATYSKIVRTIQINLDCYDEYPAYDADAFVFYMVSNISDYIDEWRHPDIARLLRISDDALTQMLDTLTAIERSWEDYNGEYPDEIPEDGPAHHKLLQRAAHLYRDKYKDQDQLLGKDYVKSIADAYARMPNARRCEIGNCVEPCRAHFVTSLSSADDEDILLESLLKPRSRPDVTDYEIDMIFELPIAISHAGGMLVELDIQFEPPEHFRTCFSIMPTEAKNLAAAVQNLRSLCFHIKTDPTLKPWPDRSWDEIRDLGQYLNSVMSTDSLHSVTLDFGSLFNCKRSPPRSSGSMLSLGHLSRLRSLSLNAAPVLLEELQWLIGAMDPPPSALELTWVYLLSGTWAEALDTLRSRSTLDWHVICLRGAECENMSKRELDAIFSKPKGEARSISAADGYIQKRHDLNPLRERKKSQS